MKVISSIRNESKKMAKVNATTIRKAADRNKSRPKPLTPQEIKSNTIKKYGKMAGILILGTLVGATIGISNERDRNMDTYSQQSYDAGITDAKKTWYASIVKANSAESIDIDKIQMPIDGIVSRSEDGDLFCKSKITEGINFTVGELEEFKCNYVTTRASEFYVGELEKVIPHNGKIERISESVYSCDTSSLSISRVTLEECVSFLRIELFSEYNDFIDANYLPKDVTHLTIRWHAPEPYSSSDASFENDFGMGPGGGSPISGGTLSGGAGFGSPDIEGGVASGGSGGLLSGEAGGILSGPGGEPAESSSTGGWTVSGGAGIGIDLED